MSIQALYITAPLGLELLLGEELEQLGAVSVKPGRAGVSCEANIETALRICLWSRLANRVLMPICRQPAATPEELYDAVQSVDWADYFAVSSTFAIDFTTRRSQIKHTLFGAQKAKDAVVDQFLAHTGQRPSVQLDQPDVRINVHLDQDVAAISLDLSGDSLHRRGYRLEAGIAPLKENLAAALLMRAGWPALAQTGGQLIDPMCGSATLVIEGALMACDMAPGLSRRYFGFMGLKLYPRECWEGLLDEAMARARVGLTSPPLINGYDADPRMIDLAHNNIARAGLDGVVRVERQLLDRLQPNQPEGLLIVNPPYGERMGEQDNLRIVYRALGDRLKSAFVGWHASVFTGNPELAFQIGLRARKQYALYNGALPCRLFNFKVEPEHFFIARSSEQESDSQKYERRVQNLAAQVQVDESAAMLRNRLQKNLKHLGQWARRSGISCYRLYDADLPEYAVAVDLYPCDELRVLVQEYAPPASIEPAKAEQRLVVAIAMIQEVLGISPHQLVLKTRKRQRGSAQYERRADAGDFYPIQEGGLNFWVNFEDYLDTGIFLDHRMTRDLIRQQAKGRHFLNLFAYTGTATVYAAAGGALSTVSVDMSNTYLEWAGRNLSLNDMAAGDHQRVHADCMQWLDQAAQRGRRYGLIFLDPPTFSNSKRMEAVLDIQRDHPRMLALATRLLTPDGVLYFSTNCRQFKLDSSGLDHCFIEDLSRKTLPKDFERNARIHYCWSIRLKP